MTILEIFEKVNLHIPLEQRRFFNYFNDTIEELIVRYDRFSPDLVSECGKTVFTADDLNNEYKILELYSSAIVDNILHCAGEDKDGSLKNSFRDKAENTYLKYWNERTRGKHIKRLEW